MPDDKEKPPTREEIKELARRLREASKKAKEREIYYEEAEKENWWNCARRKGA